MKSFLTFFILSVLSFSALAYENTDITKANFLASENIIVDQSQSSEKYNLDAKILRQEVIAMALKIKGITLPENYTCKGYYSDTKQNDWVCRAIEIAADNGIITRGNNQANPGKYVTRAEALAMLLNAGGLAGELTTEDGPPLDRDDEYVFLHTNEWQRNIITKALMHGVLSYDDGIIGIDSKHQLWNTYTVTFYPDRPATRSEVFEFASKIFAKRNPENTRSIFQFADRDVVLTFLNTSKKAEMDEKFIKVENTDTYTSENPGGNEIMKIIDQKTLDSEARNSESSNPMDNNEGTEFFKFKNTFSTITISNQKWISLKENNKHIVVFSDGAVSGSEEEFVQCLYKMADNKYFAIMTEGSAIDARVDNCDFFIKNLSHIQILLK